MVKRKPKGNGWVSRGVKGFINTVDVITGILGVRGKEGEKRELNYQAFKSLKEGSAPARSGYLQGGL